MNPLTSEILAGQRAAEDPDAASNAPGGDTVLDDVAEQTITTTDSRADDTHAVPFRDLGVSETICLALEGAGIHTTFPIQALALPIALGGYDIIGQARTGTGKTMGFTVPILQKIDAPGDVVDDVPALRTPEVGGRASRLTSRARAVRKAVR